LPLAAFCPHPGEQRMCQAASFDKAKQGKDIAKAGTFSH
jgi:hypothetical protein